MPTFKAKFYVESIWITNRVTQHDVHAQAAFGDIVIHTTLDAEKANAIAAKLNAALTEAVA